MESDDDASSSSSNDDRMQPPIIAFKAWVNNALAENRLSIHADAWEPNGDVDNLVAAAALTGANLVRFATDILALLDVPVREGRALSHQYAGWLTQDEFSVSILDLAWHLLDAYHDAIGAQLAHIARHAAKRRRPGDDDDDAVRRVRARREATAEALLADVPDEMRGEIRAHLHTYRDLESLSLVSRQFNTESTAVAAWRLLVERDIGSTLGHALPAEGEAGESLSLLQLRRVLRQDPGTLRRQPALVLKRLYTTTMSQLADRLAQQATRRLKVSTGQSMYASLPRRMGLHTYGAGFRVRAANGAAVDFYWELPGPNEDYLRVRLTGMPPVLHGRVAEAIRDVQAYFAAHGQLRLHNKATAREATKVLSTLFYELLLGVDPALELILADDDQHRAVRVISLATSGRPETRDRQ